MEISPKSNLTLHLSTSGQLQFIENLSVIPELEKERYICVLMFSLWSFSLAKWTTKLFPQFHTSVWQMFTCYVNSQNCFSIIHFNLPECSITKWSSTSFLHHVRLPESSLIFEVNVNTFSCVPMFQKVHLDCLIQ